MKSKEQLIIEKQKELIKYLQRPISEQDYFWCREKQRIESDISALESPSDQGEKPSDSEKASEYYGRLYEGREYLMSVPSDEITVEDALEAFGFGRNGLDN